MHRRTSRRLFTAIILTILSSSGPGMQKATEKSGVIGIWISPEEIAELPTTGDAWKKVKRAADTDFGKAKGGHNDNHDVYTLAQAYVAVRLNDDTYRAKVAQNVLSAIGSEDNGNVLSLARNLIGYVIAADLIDFKQFDSEGEVRFRNWLSMVRHKELGGQGTLISIHEKRPNNFGTHATAARAAAAIYLGDREDLERTAKIFKGWTGDRASYSNFKYGDLSWQADPGSPVGINPKGSTKNGHSIDGVLPDDQRRGGGFKWPPPKENYVYGALQGAAAAANILNRAGYDTWNWQDKALLRAYVWLHREASFAPTGDDVWQLPLIDSVYGTQFWNGDQVKLGKNMGWTDWTHGSKRSSADESNTSIRGAVLNSTDNRGLADASLQLRAAGEIKYETSTNFLGQFSFNFIDAGSYSLTAAKDGFEEKSLDVSVPNGQQVSAVVALVPLQDAEAPQPPQNVTAKN